MEVHMMLFSSEHTKWDQNPKFTSLAQHPRPFHMQVPPPPGGLQYTDTKHIRKQTFHTLYSKNILQEYTQA